MERIRSIEEAKERMQKSVNFYACRIQAWENVKRLYKKDGGQFSVLSKNFSNCQFINQYGSNYLRVCFRDEFNGFTYDDINLEGNVYGVEKADTPNKIQKRIDGLLANYRAWKEKDEAGLNAIEKQINEILPLLDEIKTALKDAEAINTHYTIKAFIKDYLNII